MPKATQPAAPAEAEPERDYRDRVEQLTGVSLWKCPTCRLGQMVCIEVLKPIIGFFYSKVRKTTQFEAAVLA
jgi:hypothetical protein